MEVATTLPEGNECSTIKATGVPHEFFENRDTAKRYFRRFGKVKLVSFKPKRNSILIEYATEDGMLNALAVGGEYNGHLFAVDRDNSIVRRKKKVKKTVDPDWVKDPEVKAELEAMGAFPATRSFVLRSDAMLVDSEEPTKIRKWGSPKAQKKKIATGKDTNMSDLQQIIKQQALTVDDKFKILEARDKLIRFRMKKSMELSKATIGNCPDMCPEKERLLREIQHQVALYEQSDNSRELNSLLAVKQYSRSSADQESPLPSELRPVNVLQMTMGYLMHRIIGLCDTQDVNLGEWYHFLWDRTRGIRKDITQQELCCQGSVELVEQCARFHIFCSARLVAEDVSVFDQKINTENLTKCLQTLKYMYDDLQLKGENCKNEAEFRAYIILLNLNDGNFMWEVQQLKPLIQQSPEVKFALAVYSTLDKHNHVKFFKLVRQTSFLNACILMRYFIQIRIAAITILLKSYSPRVSQTSLPIVYLTKILAFENQEATIEFFESYNLYTDIDRNRIILDKNVFGPPEYPYNIDRAVILIESKRTQTIGETICGREMPPKIYETHLPQNSFDENGFLKVLPPDFEEEMNERPIAMEQPRQATPTIHVKPMEEEEVFKPIVANLFNDFFPKVTNSGPIFGGQVETTVPPTEEVESEAALEETRRLLILQQQKVREDEEKRLKEIEEQKRREEIRLKIIREEEIKRRVREEALQKRIEEERQRQEKVKQKLLDIRLGVCQMMSDLLDRVELNVRQSKLTEIVSKQRDRKLRRIIQKWRENCRRKRKRKALDFEPFWFGSCDLITKTKSQSLVLENMKRYKTGKAWEIQIDERKIKRIDLIKLTYDLLTKKFFEVEGKAQQELFWKITISLPSESEFSNGGLSFFEKILDDFIQWEKRAGSTVLIQQSKTKPTLTYCLEKQKGFVCKKLRTNGLIFIADCINQQLLQRIQDNFQQFGKLTEIPLVIILQKYHETDNLENILKTPYLILVDHFNGENFTDLIEEALVFLAEKLQKSPPLELDTFKAFLMENLSTNLWKRANSFAKWNSNYKNCLKIPNTAIYLHNEAVNRLRQILIDKNIQEYQKFPEIFKELLRNQIPDFLPCDYRYFPTFWDSPIYSEKITNILENLILPNFLIDWPIENQLELEVSMSQYCQKIVGDSQKVFFKVMGILLRQPFKDALWSDIIELIALEKLNQIDFSLYGTGFVNQSIFNQLIVVYDVNCLSNYTKSDWFYINNPIIKTKVTQMLQKEKTKLTVVQDESEEDELESILAKINSPKRHLNVQSLKNDISSCKKLLNDLEDSVTVHKKILKQTGSFLTNLIDNS